MVPQDDIGVVQVSVENEELILVKSVDIQNANCRLANYDKQTN
jgi:hypothetical protein